MADVTYPYERPRRLRRTTALRRLVQETRLHPADLICPLFVVEGSSERIPIDSMPGQFQETEESVLEAVREAVAVGCGAVLIFGVPATKDAEGSGAWADDGVVQASVRRIREDQGDECVVITDCCLDEYTDHGHCGVLGPDGRVDNDRTLELYSRVAVSQARAGADVIAPSGMMDGQVVAIRGALDAAGFVETAILAYTAKYASVLYGPFRMAASCAPQSGNRRGYQMDIANGREARREASLDIAEGADMLMVKPALTALDVVAAVRRSTELPVMAYCVSGEYAMIRAAAAAGAFDERSAVLETLTGIRRAGADAVITYHARQAAGWLREEDSR